MLGGRSRLSWLHCLQLLLQAEIASFPILLPQVFEGSGLLGQLDLSGLLAAKCLFVAFVRCMVLLVIFSFLLHIVNNSVY